MIDKVALGQKIQSIRESKGMSRQVLCQDEVVLTTRQLQRIEKGDSLPSIATVVYIAQQLDVSVEILVDKEKLEIPQRYLDLRYKMQRLPHYGNPERIMEREAILDEIYESFFDNLPEEEQLAVQIEHALLDIAATRRPEFDQGLVDEYLERSLAKSQLDMNDMNILFLRQLILAFNGFDKEEFVNLLSRIIHQRTNTTVEGLRLIQNVVISSIGMLCHFEEYDMLYQLHQVLEELMELIKDYSDKAFVYMTRWKINLYLEHNLEAAKENYSSARQLAQLLSEELLFTNIRNEWAEDMAKLQLVDQLL
ncbi:XRE family transcriptional regulator [Streptococcus minor]|uniref:XRE family transcriptional regulator n=1 Tax=Streptococcus minor TaxID=229549 RepID=A0A3P1VDL4_9STRE|nr:XRE family transcriptional regulator [Streptococcus minor]RRD31858.1 XRE family transcriptional regulator [Streptococcus minor]